MININKEIKMLSNILKHYGNVKFITLEIATVENGRIYRTAGLLNLADKVVRYVNYFRYNKIKRFNQKEL